MNEENNNVVNNTSNIPDAVTNNPLAYQKITSKKLEVVQNPSPIAKEAEKLLLPKPVKIIIAIVILTALIILFWEIIYPTYFAKTYDVEYACEHPYNCVVNENGTKTCSFFDDNNKLVYVTCKGDGNNKKDEEENANNIDISMEDANRLVDKARRALDYSVGLSNIFVEGFTNGNSIVSTNRAKTLFLVYYLNDNGNVGINDENGLRKIDYTLLKEKYNNMFGEDFDQSILLENEYVSEGFIYLNVGNPLDNNEYLFKTKEITQDKNTYTIEVAVLKYDEGFTADELVYSNESYDETLVKYNITITIEKNNDDYIVKDIK